MIKINKKFERISKIIFGVVGVSSFLGILNSEDIFSEKIMPLIFSIGLIYASGLLNWLWKKYGYGK